MPWGWVNDRTVIFRWTVPLMPVSWMWVCSSHLTSIQPTDPCHCQKHVADCITNAQCPQGWAGNDHSISSLCFPTNESRVILHGQTLYPDKVKFEKWRLQKLVKAFITNKKIYLRAFLGNLVGYEMIIIYIPRSISQDGLTLCC